MAETDKKSKYSKAVAVIAALLLLAEALLILASWLLSASPNGRSFGGGLGSLLSGQGVRWVAAHFVEGLQSPLLIWLLLAATAIGILRKSRLFSTPFPSFHALLTPITLLAAYTLIIILLTALPHAVLLSATGHLWPSPFSEALVPIICLGIIIAAIGYGLANRTLTSFTAIVDAAADGLRNAAPLILIYILATQFYLSLHYVFM
ncbi:MAG: AbgT family transporter [Prevotella sp.]|nr:AbgT family transporter [Prevotella sp.]